MLIGENTMLGRIFLVVDDDEFDREKLKRILKKHPDTIDVQEAINTEQALQAIKERDFDCVFIDCMLMDSLGTEILSALRVKDMRPVPVIMVSGNDRTDIIKDAMRAGAQNYLCKNHLTADILLKAIQQAIEATDVQHTAWRARRRNHQLAENLPHLAWSSTLDGECEYLNRRWCDYTGIEQEEQLGYGWLSQVHPEDRDRFMQTWLRAIHKLEPIYINLRIRKSGGEYRWFDTRAIPGRDESGAVVRWLGTHTDITEYEITRKALEDSERRFRAAFDYAPLGMAMVAVNGKILKVNTALDLLLGFSHEIPSRLNVSLIGSSIKHITHPDDFANEEQKLKELILYERPVVQYEKRYIGKNNGTIFTVTSVSLVHLSGGENCFLYQVVDVSDRKKYEHQLLNLAHHDALTGLYNRVKLNEMFESFVRTCEATQKKFAILFVDLDNFKQINDGLGHESGDQLLRVVARRMQQHLRQDDCVARLGGDEFIILLNDATDKQSVGKVVEMLIQNISSPIKLDAALVHVGMSVGVAIYPEDGETVQVLMRNADSALYDAKARGRGSFQLYRPELTEIANQQLILDADLRNAINNDEFEIYYQPLVDMDTGQVRSLEALLRWHHPKKGLLKPNSFIDYAHESGLIFNLGEWVLLNACQQMAQWQASGVDITLSINVSAKQFQQDTLALRIEEVLAQYGLNPKCLIVEITEQIFMEEVEAVWQRVNSLRQLGVKIALDDFGVGYSSLNYIVRFSPDYLKIDRSFIERIGEQAQHNDMVEAIVGLSKIVPLEVIAEGVETQAQFDFLLGCGCHVAQGYYFSEPQPANISKRPTNPTYPLTAQGIKSSRLSSCAREGSVSSNN
ncbi:MAG: hypothetical protein RL497_1768 [Pseudomonadota bacterium]